MQQDSALTVGVFDGVHRGHRHLISRLRVVAERSGLVPGVLTFRNHPSSVLQPDFTPRYITGVYERIRMFRELGIELSAPITFDAELSRLSAVRFMEMLQEHPRLKTLVVGPDFALGHKREGDIDTLKAMGREMGFSVHVVEPLLDDEGRPIKSTFIRQALSRGDVGRAAELLGRGFSLTGTVVKGRGRGVALRFPTANLQVADGRVLPGDGIYATWAQVGDRRHMAATSVGKRPTFDDDEHAVEAFLLDFDGDLYGREVRLEFVRRLRDEVKFDSAAALQDQIRSDVDQARAVLGESRHHNDS